jgi:hypothetical protein
MCLIIEIGFDLRKCITNDGMQLAEYLQGRHRTVCYERTLKRMPVNEDYLRKTNNVSPKYIDTRERADTGSPLALSRTLFVLLFHE